MRADGRQGGKQGRVLERPARHRRKQRELPTRAKRRQDAVALAQQPAGKLSQRLGARPQPVANSLDRASHPCQRSIEREQRGARRQQDHEDGHADHGTLDQTAADAATDECRYGKDGQGEHDPEGQKIRRRQAADHIRARHTRLHEQPVLKCSADGAAAGRDPGERAARHL